ncbi:MAG: DcaP family trimeric outer membrane transporter [Aquisalimonadaceae bacterium]
MFKMNTRGIATGMITALALVANGKAVAVEMQAGKTVVNLYGYAKLDIIQDFNADIGASVDHGAIGLDDAEVPEGHTRLQAIESRLGVRTTTPTEAGDLTTVIEGDFYGAGSGGFRLRQAYGELNGVLAGHTWSNFATFTGHTSTIDFTGQPGQTVLSLQTQLRYTDGGLSLAIEAPGYLGGTLEPVGGVDVDKNGLPDLTARYEGGLGSLGYAIAGVLRQIGADDGSDSDTAIGYGLNLAGSYQLAPGVSAQGGVTFGDGIGGYMYINPASPAYLDGDSIETVKSIGGTLGLSIAIGDGSMNVGYGLASADVDDAVAAGAMPGEADEQYQSLFVNYIWSPITSVTYGIEAGRHTREQADGEAGDALRLHGMVQYSF